MVCRGSKHDAVFLLSVYTRLKADSRVRQPNPVEAKVDHLLLFTVFIRRAPVEDLAASECIRTVAATYGYKILQLYEYAANSE